ncbi:hypothetical protein AOQ84DRAFT_298527, partial [Glonium stellatum]
GLVVGGVSGVVRSTTPVLFATASGIQCFLLGSGFWASRGLILHRKGIHDWVEFHRGAKLQPRDVSPPTAQEKVEASALAGGITGGMVASIVRGRQNMLPAIAMFSLFGYAGQSIYNALDARNTQEQQEKLQNQNKSEKESLLHRIAKSRWSPMKVLSDEEYENMLQEKLLRIEAEIALIDDNIEKLKQQRDQTPKDD